MSKILIFSEGTKIAECKGRVYRGDNPVNSKPLVNPNAEFNFQMRCTIEEWRQRRRQLLGKKPRLPRKLKKAAKHTEFKVFDIQPKINPSTDSENVVFDFNIDYSVITNPKRYPRTRSVQKLIRIFLRKMAQSHYNYIIRTLKQHYKEDN